MNYLKNPKTGVVFPATPILEKRGDLVPCEADGTLLHPDASPASLAANTDSPFVLNPATGVVLARTPTLSKKPGLIPCQSPEHGRSIYEGLKATTTEPEAHEAPNVSADGATGTGEQGAKSVQTETESHALSHGDQTQREPVPAGETLTEEQIDAIDDVEQLKTIAAQYNEKLDGRYSIETLREQVKVMVATQPQVA